jgi:hypothetical protein
VAIITGILFDNMYFRKLSRKLAQAAISFVLCMYVGLFMLLGVVCIARPPFLTNSSFDVNNLVS